MSDEVKHDFFLVAYEGRSAADHVYEILRDQEKRGTIDIRTAAVITRKSNGKLRLDHKRRVTVVKGTTLGLLVGLIVGGPVIGAAAGALIGSSRSGDRRKIKEYLQTKLGPNQSALAILVNSADWEAIHDAIKHRNGEVLKMELTPGSVDEVEKLMNEDEPPAAVTEDVEEVEDAGDDDE